MKTHIKSLHFWSILVLFITFGNLAGAQTCYVTKTGSKYHKETCRYVRYSKISITLDDAIKKGYEKCKICKPTRENLKDSTAGIIYSSPPIGTCSAVQCSGTTQKGRRCRNKTKDCSGRCHHHRS